jgi:hypothetical protein
MLRRFDHYQNALDRVDGEFNIIGETSNGNFIVYSYSRDKQYEVSVENDIVFDCTCPHAFHRKVCCKHQAFVAKVYGYEIDELHKLKNI